jgi:hypothetical protein
MQICIQCGGWIASPTFERPDPNTLFLVCPHCQGREPFAQYPLWWISGSSGAGKSALAPLLRRALPEGIIFEGEAIDFWRFAGEPGDYSSLYNQWLKVAREIAMSGRPVVFLATALPDQLDACTLRPCFATIYFLGLVCDESIQARRLLARPAWRNAGSAEFIAQACAFTRALRTLGEQGTSTITLLDTTAITPEQAATKIATWVRKALQ